MAQPRGNNGYSYQWGRNSDPNQDLRHQVSSISAVSTLDPNDHDLRHQASNISTVSSMDHDNGYSGAGDFMLPQGMGSSRMGLQSRDEVDVSRIQISYTGNYERTSAQRQSQLPSRLPDALRVGTPTPPLESSKTFNPFRSSTQAYEPVQAGPLSPPRATPGRSGSRRHSKRRGSLLSLKHNTIPEGEEIDMGLLGSAMPMGYVKQTTYASVEEEREDGPMISPMVFDVSSYTGPPQNAEQLREVNLQESNGILTGGLGVGLKAETTIMSTDLLANAPQTPSTPGAISRRVTFRSSPFRGPSFRNTGLARAPTLKDLGQAEANKRGEIVRVIVEEPTVDISSFAGGSTNTIDFDTVDSKSARKNTLQRMNTELFYPQANWKPFSMRWPYLTALIVVSVILAAAQEFLFQKSQRKPLYKFQSANDLSTWEYFSFKYLPTLIAVSFGVLWQVTDFEVKRLEAFYQLSKEGGALAAESINVDYITFFNFLRPVRALKYKHYAVAVSSVATLVAVSLVPTLQATSIVLSSAADSDSSFLEIRMSSVYSRLLSVVLVFIAIMGCVLVWQLERRPSGLVADVKGIAGIAAMANRSHILMDFKDMDTASPELIHQKLKTHRYSLRNSSLAPEEGVTLTQEEKDKYDQHVRPENPHPLMLRLIAGVPFIISMILFMILIPMILFPGHIVTTSAPWLLTLLAVCIKLAWGTLETDVRMIEPFYILSKRHASPKVLTLDYSSMAFGWMPIRAFLNGHFLVGLVGLGSVLAEVLTVCCTSFANISGINFRSGSSGSGSGEETFLSFWLSFSLALLILCFLCLVATLVYMRRRHPFLPRQPNTIASILAFIHQSKMLYDFVGTEKMSNGEMVKRLGSIGKTYGLGWFVGRDGEVHCGVDEEELVSVYKHGDDARKASQPWTTNWENY